MERPGVEDSYTELQSTDLTELRSALPTNNGSKQVQDHYQLFLLVQDMFRTAPVNFIEFEHHLKQSAIPRQLGKGGGASVQSVASQYAHSRWGKPNMAIKSSIPSFDADGKEDRKGVLSEVIRELRVLAHPRIRVYNNINAVNGVLFGQFLLPSLMLDPCPFGNLLQAAPVMNEECEIWEVCSTIARALKLLHSNSFIHGDVKCENVLVFPSLSLDKGRFTAKLTDFGCSMVVAEVESFTKLLGYTPPYDAPEANDTIPKEWLPFTDVYSFGLLVLRVALSGQDPFAHPSYSEPSSEAQDRGTAYKHGKIREDKRDESLLSHSLSLIANFEHLDPGLIDGLSEVLSVALISEPERRNLDLILSIFEERSFGGIVPNFPKFNDSNYIPRRLGKLKKLSEQVQHAQQFQPSSEASSRSFFQSQLQGDVAGQLNKTLDDTLDPTTDLANFTGDILSIFDKMNTMLKNIPQRDDELSSWNLDSFKDAILPGLAALSRSPPKGTSRDKLLTESIRKLDESGEEDSQQVLRQLANSLGQPEQIKANTSSALNKGKERQDSVLTADWGQDIGTGAQLDLMLDTDGEPTSSLDFDLLNCCGLPYGVQKQLFVDIQARITISKGFGAVNLELVMDQALCYLLGFGTPRDPAKYLSLLVECCEHGHFPAQECIYRAYSALGLPIPQNLPLEAWLIRAADSGSDIAASDLATLGLTENDLEAKRRRRSCIPYSHISRDSTGVDPQEFLVHEAVLSGSRSAVIELVSGNRACINGQDRAGNTPLIYSCLAGDSEMLDLLLENGADARTTNGRGENALHFLSLFPAAEVVTVAQKLANAGANPDARACMRCNPGSLTDHGTPLHRAISHGNSAAVKVLLYLGSSPTLAVGPIHVYKSHTLRCDAIQLACMLHEPEILSVLLDSIPHYRMNVDEHTRISLLYFAVKSYSMHRRIVQHGAGLYGSMWKTFAFLLKSGSKTVVNEEGHSALHAAVISGWIDILEHLLTIDELAADINALVGGLSPLHNSIIQEDEEKLELLMRHGADPLQLTAQKLPQCRGKHTNPLALAATVSKQGSRIAQRLLDRMPETPQQHLDHALGVALVSRESSLSEALLERGASLNGLDENGCGYLSVVLRHGNPFDSIEGLEDYIRLSEKFQQRPEFIVQASSQDSALHFGAAQTGLRERYEFARLYTMLLALFPEKYHLEARNLKGYTPLHMAIHSRNPVGVRCLLDAGADINSLQLLDDIPVGPSPKDMVFMQVFTSIQPLDVNEDTRRASEQGLQEMLQIFREPELYSRARRSETVRALRRREAQMTPLEKRYADFVDVLSFLPDQLPQPENSIMGLEYVKAFQKGQLDEDEFAELGFHEAEFAATQGRRVQWNGVDGVRFLKHKGRRDLVKMGLWNDYLDP